MDYYHYQDIVVDSLIKVGHGIINLLIEPKAKAFGFRYKTKDYGQWK